MSKDVKEIIREFKDARKDGFIHAKEIKESGGSIVGTYCTYTPKELIYAVGAYPVSLCAVSEETIPAGEKHLPKNLCPLIKSSYGHALKDSCPYMYFSDLVVGETTCDGKKKMYELLGEIKDTYVMELPNNQENEYAKIMWKQEILKFRSKLEDKFRKKIDDESLRKAIKDCNEERKILKEFYGLGKLVPPPLTGQEMQTILSAVVYSFHREEQNKKIVQLTELFREIHRNGEERVSPNAPRILITGCPIGGVADKIINQLEEVGAVVVAYENCGGAKNLARLVDETQDPIDALAEKYLSIPCSVMSPNKGREELLEELIQEYKVDGVVEIVLQACHTYAVETRNIKKKVSSLGVPFMSLETDYSKSDSGQIRTRLEAFVEML